MKLSICMMIKNEETHLRECLDSLQPFFKQDGLSSELIIVDTGSTDESVKIASEFTDKIYFHEWNNDFSSMRNITISYATGEWIFIIDGDEVLYNAENIIEFLLHKNSAKFNTGTLLVKSWIDSKMEKFTALNSFRLFRRDSDFRYEGKVHNQPIFKQPLVNFTEAELVHYGYIATDKDLMDKKFERTVTLLKEELEEDPENLYYWYQLGESYGLYGNNEAALEAMMKAYNLAVSKGEKAKKDYLYIFIGAGKRNMAMRKPEEAEQILKEVLEIGQDYPDLHYFLGHALYIQGKIQEALEHYDKYIYIAEHFNEFGSARDLSVKNETVTEIENVYKIAAEEYYKLEVYNKAEMYFRAYESLKSDEKLGAYIIYSMYKQGKIEEIFPYYNEKYLDADEKYREELVEVIERIYHQSSNEVRAEIAYLFKGEISEYQILHTVRYLKMQKEVDVSKIKIVLENIELNHWKIKIGELLWAMIECNIDLVEKTRNMYEVEINEKFDEIIPQMIALNKYIDFTFMANEMNRYLIDLQLVYDGLENINYLRIAKIISRFCVTLPDTKDNLYQIMFEQYVDYGTLYLSKVYNMELLKDENFCHLKNLEDKFLLYMWKANSNKDSNREKYFYYLKKVLDIGEFNRAIKYLLKNFNKTLEEPRDELEVLKSQLKDNIRNLINEIRLEEAKLLINQYEQIVDNDPEILLFKTEVLVGETTLH